MKAPALAGLERELHGRRGSPQRRERLPGFVFGISRAGVVIAYEVTGQAPKHVTYRRPDGTEGRVPREPLERLGEVANAGRHRGAADHTVYVSAARAAAAFRARRSTESGGAGTTAVAPPMPGSDLLEALLPDTPGRDDD